MKIEIGESLALSYLKHVKKCVIYQNNWKISSRWDTFNEEAVENVFNKINEYDVFENFFPGKKLKEKVALCKKLKQTKTHTNEPIIQQTEIDTICQICKRAEISAIKNILQQTEIDTIENMLKKAEIDATNKKRKQNEIDALNQILEQNKQDNSNKEHKQNETDTYNNELTQTKIDAICKILKKAEIDALNQILKQAEIDTLGMDKEGKIYTMDIAFHEGGLNYRSNKEETARRIIEKLLSSYMMLLRYFPDRDYEIIFASPKVREETESVIIQSFNDLNTFFDNNVELQNKVKLKNNVEFKYISNEEFRKEILDKTIKASEKDSDTNELFMRSYKLLELFDRVSNIAKEEIDLDKEIPPTAFLVLEFEPSDENAIQAITDKS